MASCEHCSAFTSGDNNGPNHPYTAGAQVNSAVTSESCYPRSAGWAGDHSHQISHSVSNASSRSPASSWHVVTSNASNSGDSVLDEVETDDNLSSTSHGGYVHLSSAHVHSRASLSDPQTSNASGDRHLPSSSQGSGAFNVQHQSRAFTPSSVGSSFTPWGRAGADGDVFMCDQQAHHCASHSNAFYTPLSYTGVENAPSSAGQTYSDVASSAFTTMNAQTCNAPLPHQAGHGHDQYGLTPNIYGSSSSYHPQGRSYGPSDPYGQQQQHTHKLHDISDTDFLPELHIPWTGSLLMQPQPNAVTVAQKEEQAHSPPSPTPTVPHVARRSFPPVPFHRSSPYLQQGARPGSSTSAALQYLPQAAMHQSQAGGNASHSPPQAARPGPVPSSASRAPAAEQGRKGGRPIGRHFADEAEVKSSQMRKVVACWRCALQRDPVCPDHLLSSGST